MTKLLVYSSLDVKCAKTGFTVLPFIKLLLEDLVQNSFVSILVFTFV